MRPGEIALYLEKEASIVGLKANQQTQSSHLACIRGQNIEGIEKSVLAGIDSADNGTEFGVAWCINSAKFAFAGSVTL